MIALAAFSTWASALLFLVACFIALLIWMAWEYRRPLSEVDRYCAGVDQELDAREREARHRQVVARMNAVGEAAEDADWEWAA